MNKIETIRIGEEEEDDLNDNTRQKTNFFSKISTMSTMSTSNKKNNELNTNDSPTNEGFFSKLTGVTKSNESSNVNLFKTEETSTSIKIGNKLKVGYYRLSSETKVVKYVYVPSTLASSSAFNIDDIFVAFGITTPNLMFEMNIALDVDTWNVRVPPYKSNLIGSKHPNPPHHYNGALRHYEGVIKENCKRLLRGTSTACSQAGAIFNVRPAWRDKYAVDSISEWLSEVTTVPILGIASFHNYHPDIVQRMMENAYTFNSNATDDDEEELRKILNIDTEPWYSGKIKHGLDDKLMPISSMPFPKMSHLIISDDVNILREKIDRGIPNGLIVIHGGPGATIKFCETIQRGNPIFLFKYTGGTADLACETIAKVDAYLRKKRANPNTRPDHPFGTNLPMDYQHPRWIKGFSKDNLESCRHLNILIENFPDRYNPASVLQIDMFNTSEEKLQDQLTKTMSVVFEGVVELGGASAESRRLTYAWRMRHLFAYNASRQKLLSDILQALIILFSLISTITAVSYTYMNSQDCSLSTGSFFSSSNKSYQSLLMLNLLLPLTVTILRGFFASLDPLTKYAILKMAAIRIESEIYMYRTKVGRYNTRKITSSQQSNTQHSNSSKSKKDDKDEHQTTVNPRKIFSQALDSLWNEITSDMAAGVLRSPPDTSDPLDSINRRISSNLSEQNWLRNNLKQPSKIKEKSDKEKISSYFSLFRSQKKPSMSDDDINMADIYKSSEVNDSSHKALNLSPLGSRQRSNSDNESIAGDNASTVGDGSVRSVQSSTHNPDVENGKTKNVEECNELDDGLGNLTADEYVKIRLTPLMASFTTKAPPMASINTCVSLITILLSVVSSVLTTFQLVTFIPVALALSSALSSWSSYLQIELRLCRTNSALHQLHQLVVWWDSLNMIEKRVSTNKEYLVQITEAAIQGQIVSAVSSKTNNNEGDDDDDTKDTKF